MIGHYVFVKCELLLYTSFSLWWLNFVRCQPICFCTINCKKIRSSGSATELCICCIGAQAFIFHNRLLNFRGIDLRIKLSFYLIFSFSTYNNGHISFWCQVASRPFQHTFVQRCCCKWRQWFYRYASSDSEGLRSEAPTPSMMSFSSVNFCNGGCWLLAASMKLDFAHVAL